jgi:hypothetical protein
VYRYAAVLEHHDKGSMGVILNRPTQYNMGGVYVRGCSTPLRTPTIPSHVLLPSHLSWHDTRRNLIVMRIHRIATVIAGGYCLVCFTFFLEYVLKDFTPK